MTAATTETTGSADGRRTEYLPLAGLEADPRNPKAHDLDTIDASVGRFGIIDPIVRDDRTGRLISGHGRAATLRAMQERGEAPPDGVRVDAEGNWLVPVTVGWASRTDTEAHAALIALNRTTELGGWVDDELLGLLDELSAQDGGLDGVGFPTEDIEDLRSRLEGLNEEGRDPWRDRALQAKPDPGETRTGQVWKVGAHLLACGDSRDPALWRRLLGEQRAVAMFTDPPYGIGYSGGGGVEREALDGDATSEEAVSLLTDVLDAVTQAESLGPGAASYVCLPSGTAFPPMASLLLDRGLYRWLLIWVKDNATFGRADYHQQHEVIVYGWWPGARHPVLDRTQTSVWSVPRPSDSDRHPTEKPVDLALRALENSTDPGGLVIDPFAGSGSTLVAAQRSGRVGVGVEVEPGYVSEALRWLEDETGESRALLEG